LNPKRLPVTLVASLLVSTACFSPNSPIPSSDASTSADATVPVRDASSTPADAWIAPEAAVDAPFTPVDSGAPDAGSEAGPAAPSCGGWDAAIELDASDSDGATSPNADGGPPLPGPPPSSCSVDGDIHAPFEVINNSPCPIDVWWVDYLCAEEYYGTVAPNGGTWSNDTWETSPWRIRLSGSEALLLEIPPVPEGVDASLRTIVYP
jgi:hypothetical protein